MKKFNMSEVACNKLESTNAFPWLKLFSIPLCPSEDPMTPSGQWDKSIEPEQLREKKHFLQKYQVLSVKVRHRGYKKSILMLFTRSGLHPNFTARANRIRALGTGRQERESG